NARTVGLIPGTPGAAAAFRLGPGQQTPLLVAARNNRVDAMRALIAGGADPKLKAQDGTTLLLAAAASGRLEAVEYAYQFDQDVPAKTDAGPTAMHAAVTGTPARATQAQICAMIQFLADKGAPLDEKDNRGRTPISIADVIPIDNAVTLLTSLIE